MEAGVRYSFPSGVLLGGQIGYEHYCNDIFGAVSDTQLDKIDGLIIFGVNLDGNSIGSASTGEGSAASSE